MYFSYAYVNYFTKLVYMYKSSYVNNTRENVNVRSDVTRRQ